MHGLRTIRKLNGSYPEVKPDDCNGCKAYDKLGTGLPCRECYNRDEFVPKYSRVDKLTILSKRVAAMPLMAFLAFLDLIDSTIPDRKM